MSKIVLVADGQFDSNKLCTALKRMVIDPSKEVVDIIQYKDVEYVNDEGQNCKRDFFMGQIKDREEKEAPRIITYKDDNGVEKNVLFFGIVNAEKVLNSDIIDKLVDEEDKGRIYDNPNLLLSYLYEKIDAGKLDETILSKRMDIYLYLVRYNVDGIYSFIDMNPNCTRFIFQNKLLRFCYAHVALDKTRVLCSSKEVMNYLGLNYSEYGDISINSSYGLINRNCSSFNCFSSLELLDENSNIFPVNESNLDSVQVNNYIYTYKNKNK